MKISRKYLEALDMYLDWENVTTPASGSFQEERKPRPQIAIGSNGVSAAEALCIWESTGKPSVVAPAESILLERYIKGKSQRDWWFMEIGWWNKNGAFVPEEFIRHLNPLAFIDLFGRAPIPRMVRYYFDSNYSLWEFKLDSLMTSKVFKWNMVYFERDDRESSIRNAFRMIRLKWLEPSVYRAKRLICD